MSKVSPESIDAKLERLGHIINGLEPISLEKASQMLTASDAPPPTKDELLCVMHLIERQMEQLTKLHDLIEHLIAE